MSNIPRTTSRPAIKVAAIVAVVLALLATSACGPIKSSSGTAAATAEATADAPPAPAPDPGPAVTVPELAGPCQPGVPKCIGTMYVGQVGYTTSDFIRDTGDPNSGPVLIKIGAYHDQPEPGYALRFEVTTTGVDVCLPADIQLDRDENAKGFLVNFTPEAPECQE